MAAIGAPVNVALAFYRSGTTKINSLSGMAQSLGARSSRNGPRRLRGSPLSSARPARLRLGRYVSPGGAGGAAHESVDGFAALHGALSVGAGVVAVAPSAAVEDEPRGGDGGLGRSADVQHVWGEGQRLTWARAVDIPQAPVDAVRDAGADVVPTRRVGQ